MGCCCVKAKVTDFHKMEDDESDSESDDSRSEGDGKFECPICLGTSTKKLRATPCAHVFHAKCLKAWARRNPVCPTCRHKLIV